MGKRLIALLMMMVMLVSMTATTYASENTSIGIDGPTELFIENCNNLFNNPVKYKALDKNNFDVTAGFVNKYRSAYEAKNYDLLYEAFKDELYAITWEEVEDSVYTLRGTTATTSAYKDFYVLQTIRNLVPGTDFEFLYRVSGTYTYDSAAYCINKIVNSKVQLLSIAYGALLSHEITNSSASGRIDSTGTYAVFTGSLSLGLYFNGSGVDVPINRYESFGPYTGTVTGYPQ